jgi:hypothetical protein
MNPSGIVVLHAKEIVESPSLLKSKECINRMLIDILFVAGIAFTQVVLTWYGVYVSEGEHRIRNAVIIGFVDLQRRGVLPPISLSITSRG